MRRLADRERIERFMRALGLVAEQPGRAFLTGGATAVLEGWHGPFVSQQGRLAFHHYDFYAQALAKIERGHAQDLADVREMRRRGRIDAARLGEMLDAIEPSLYRFPAGDPQGFRRAVEAVLAEPS